MFFVKTFANLGKFFTLTHQKMLFIIILENISQINRKEIKKTRNFNNMSEREKKFSVNYNRNHFMLELIPLIPWKMSVKTF